MAFFRSPEEAELRAQLRSERDYQQLKRLRKERRENKIYEQWALERKVLEKRISGALLSQDSDQLAKAFHELREAAKKPNTRRLVYYPYRSFTSYCCGRWHLDPEKVKRLINPFLNSVIAQEYKRRRTNREH
jgi:hypothetical protein